MGGNSGRRKVNLPKRDIRPKSAYSKSRFQSCLLADLVSGNPIECAMSLNGNDLTSV